MKKYNTDKQLNDDPSKFSFPESMKYLFMDIRSKVGNEKIVLGIDSSTHLTFHFGTKSNVMDIHLTDESKSGEEKHQTLMKLSHENGNQLMEEMGKAFKEVLNDFSIKRINLGKLNRHNCILSPTGNVPQLTSTFIKQKRSKLKFQREFEVEHLNQMFLYPTDRIEFHDSKSFMVHKYHKGILSYQGVIMFPKNHLTRNPYFISKRLMNKIKKNIFIVLLNYVRSNLIELNGNLVAKIEKVGRIKYGLNN